MRDRIIVLLILLIRTQSLFAQGLLELKEKTLVYDAIFIGADGDTLTKEIIEFNFTLNPWTFANQNELTFTYFTDTIAIKEFIHPFEKVRKKHERNQRKRDQKKAGWENWTWLDKTVGTGYILNDSIFWIHPPRENQYIFNEISGMPEINLKQLFIGGHWQAKLKIMMGWYDFKGTVESSYQVVGKQSYTIKDVSVPEAWEIKANHSHSKLGESHSSILFDDKKFGFLQFDNSFYDGKRIVISLKGLYKTPD